MRTAGFGTATVWLAVGVLAAGVGGGPAPAAAQFAGQQLAIAGRTELACIDADRNGVIDSADCCLTGFADVESSSGPIVADLCFLALQGSSPTKIRGCQAE